MRRASNCAVMIYMHVVELVELSMDLRLIVSLLICSIPSSSDYYYWASSWS